MTITKIETNFKRNLFWNESKMKFSKLLNTTEKGLINIYPEIEFQKILGFGGALTESSGYCLKNVNPNTANNILDDYFSDNGLGYYLCRIPIGSCDFSLSSYSYANNKDLSDFSINKDLKYIIPLIHDATSKKPNLKLLATPWSPPSFMKDSKRLILGGKLLKEFYDTYSDYLVKYILEYKKNNIDIHYITIQNEPNATQIWESCLFTPEEEKEFANNYLHPKFEKNNIKTKIIAWDHNKERLYSRSKVIFNKLQNSISGMAVHWYSGDYFEEIELTKKAFPDKLIIHTEGCTGFSNFKKSDEITNGEIYGHDILGDLNAGINGFIDWNIVLDHKGGPNHKFNYCNAPIMLNKNNSGYIKNLTYYYIGHFSKFIKPDAIRIGYSKFTSDIEVTSFKNPDNSIVVVLLNRNNFNKEFTLNFDNNTFHDNLDSHAIVTFVID